MRILFFSFFLLLPILCAAQNGFYVRLSGVALAGNEGQNAFWTYANQKGRLDATTSIMGLAEAGYRYDLHADASIILGGSLRYADGTYKDRNLDELFVSYTGKWVTIDLGIKHREERYDGLSSTGGDILWSSNAPAPPGALLQTVKNIPIFKWLGINAALGHYLLDDDRYVRDTQLHYKNLELVFALGEGQKLSAKLSHYAQFGGTSPESGKQPSGLKDFFKVVLGSSGGDGAPETDQINALGNSLGSYEVNYTLDKPHYNLEMYHQSLFEDSSGRELANFPDGVWGVYFKRKEKGILQGVLYEYNQTISQSGAPDPEKNIYRGGDNYFDNGIYRSGWTYARRIMGTPFILPGEDGLGIKNNRSIVHHLGLLGNLGRVDYLLKASLVKNLGTYGQPYSPIEKAIYSFAQFSYPSRSGTFTAILAADHSNINPDPFSVGLGYSIGF